MLRPIRAQGGINGTGISLRLLFIGLLLTLATVTGSTEASAAALYQRLQGMALVNQDGQSGTLLEDYIGDNITVVTFAYSSCTTACPILDGIFKKVQKTLNDEDRGAVNLLTITIDPVNDIPARLKQRAEMLNAAAGWNFLTGSKAQVDAVLKAFEVYTADIYSHPPTVFILDVRADKYHRLPGFPSTKLILSYIDQYQKERRDS